MKRNIFFFLNQEMCVTLVLSPVCNTSSKADSGVASYLKI